MPIYETVEVQGIQFGFALMDGIVVKTLDVRRDNFASAIKRAADLYDVFERVAIFVELGYYNDSTQFEIRNALKAVDRVNYPPSKIVDKLRSGFDAYMEEVNKKVQTHNEAYSQRQTRRAKSGYVYLLQSPTQAYKIGYSNDPDNRIKTFGIQLPFEVEYIVLIETSDMVGLENQLHQRFADKCVNGEWFNLSDEDVTYIQGLAT